MGTKIEPMPGGRALRDEPSFPARVGKPWRLGLSGVAVLAYAGGLVLEAAPFVWNDPAALLTNAAFLKLFALGCVVLVVLTSALAPRGDLTPIKTLKRRNQWGKGVMATFATIVAAELLPSRSLGLDLSIGQVDIRAINDEQLVAAVVVLSDLRILNTRGESVDLTFSADVISRGGSEESTGAFSATADCSNANGTILPDRLQELGLGGYMRTPLNIGPGSPIEGRLCLWTTGDHPAPFDPEFTLHIRDGVSQETSWVEISASGGSYEARLIRSSDPGSLALAGLP